MLVVLRAHWRNIVDGFWFVPGLVVAGFVALAFGLLVVDRNTGTDEVGLLFGGSGSAARTVLSTVAGSLITVAGLALSITIIALQLVSGQFSPRATRSLLGDRFNQVAAGSFVGIFVYCLLVLRAVREEDDGRDAFVPGLAVTTGIVLGVVGLGLLLAFIHHMAQSIKLPAIAARVAKETLRSMESLYPDGFGEAAGGPADEAAARWQEEHGAPTLVYPPRPGYVQRIALDDVARRLERPGGSRVHVLVRPGDFVTEECAVASIRPPLREDDESVEERVRRAVAVTDERQVGQDVGFGIQQLKDIVLRAVSPSVNDPSTAITCIGYLGSCLERLAASSDPDEVRGWNDGAVLVAARARPFHEHVEEAFGQLVSHAGDAHVVEAALQALALAARAAQAGGRRERLRPLVEISDRLAAAALDRQPARADRERIEAALASVRSAARLLPAAVG